MLPLLRLFPENSTNFPKLGGEILIFCSIPTILVHVISSPGKLHHVKIIFGRCETKEETHCRDTKVSPSRATPVSTSDAIEALRLQYTKYTSSMAQDGVSLLYSPEY